MDTSNTNATEPVTVLRGSGSAHLLPHFPAPNYQNRLKMQQTLGNRKFPHSTPTAARRRCISLNQTTEYSPRSMETGSVEMYASLDANDRRRGLRSYENNEFSSFPQAPQKPQCQWFKTPNEPVRTQATHWSYGKDSVRFPFMFSITLIFLRDISFITYNKLTEFVWIE